MFNSTDTKPSDFRRRPLVLIPVLVLALIFVSVAWDVRTTPRPQPMPAVITSAAPVIVAAPEIPTIVSTADRGPVTMEAASLVILARSMSAAPLQPASSAEISDDQWQQACLEVEGRRGDPLLLAECVQRGWVSLDTLLDSSAPALDLKSSERDRDR